MASLWLQDAVSDADAKSAHWILRRVSNGQVNRHPSTSGGWQLCRKCAVNPRELVVDELDLPSREILLVCRNLNQVPLSSVCGFWLCCGRCALYCGGTFPNSARLNCSDAALQHVRARKVSPLDGQHRPTLRVSNPRRHLADDGFGRVLEFYVAKSSEITNRV